MTARAWLTAIGNKAAFWITLGSLLTLLAAPHDAHAFFTALKYRSEDQGKREILSFMIPAGVSRPHIRMLDATTMRILVPGVLALPNNELKLGNSRWIKEFKMTDVPRGAEMGLQLTLTLKDPNVNYRDSVGEADPIEGALYQLEFDPPVIPSSSGPAQLLEGRILAGRDGTLVLISHTGNGQPQPTLDLGSHVAKFEWPGATLAPTWRTVAPAGLAEKITAYEFKGKTEVEISLHDSVSQVNFLHDPAAGLYIASIRSKSGIGRQEEAEKLLTQRRKSVSDKKLTPLRRIASTVYETQPDNKIRLNEQDIDERHFLDQAKSAEKDRQYIKARGYVDRLLELFPKTNNREFLDFYKLDLARQMDWKSGWLLNDLTTLIARYPNTAEYPELRLAQLTLLNRSGQFQEASAIIHDPNLPKENAQTWLERGRTVMGLIQSRIAPDESLKSGEEYLKKVIEMTRDQGPAAAEAHFLRARMAKLNGDHEAAIRILDALPPEQVAHIANQPEPLMEIADTYYKFRRYPEAVRYYAQVLSHYPTHATITPWAMLRAAESHRQLGHVNDATRLFERLKKDHATSDATVWGKIFLLQLEKDRDIHDRLEELAQILQAMSLPQDQADAFMNSVRKLLVETNRHWDVKKTLDQLAGLKKDHPKIDNEVWERIPTLQQKMEQNFKDRLTRLDTLIQEIALPEALAEAYMTKAEMLGEAGRHKEVLETLNQLMTISSRDNMVARAREIKRLYLLEGMARALENGRPEYAAILAEVHGEDWRNDPSFIPARIHLAEALMRMGLHDDALKLLDGIQGNSASSLTQLANALSRESVLDRTPTATAAAEPPKDATTKPAPLATKGASGPKSAAVPKGSANKEIQTRDAARVRLDEAARQMRKKDWEGVILLLDGVPETLFNPADRVERWRILAKAEAGLERFPQAVQHMEDLLFGRPMGDGMDYYWYASILHRWKGDDKALPAFERVAREAGNKEIQALARIRVGDILQRKGNLKAAKELFSSVPTLAPSTPWSKVSAENASQLGMALDVNP
ncbi:MAG: tetratricopeptide repeat protein [Magnetococcales bacterium]|nr:tetratricopeptide repeat protein [Magnetococcales bacterium]NGZ07558.1 tetratricopeptide repeat protein [Magnetococcales bacterium]